MLQHMNYRGAGYRIWPAGRSWLWCVGDKINTRGAIGAALTQREAIRDACASIDELIGGAAAANEIDLTCAAEWFAPAPIAWEHVLGNLARHLDTVTVTAA